MPTTQHDVYNPVPIIELWPILHSDSAFSRQPIKPQADRQHSFDDNGIQTIDIRDQRLLKVEDKHEFRSFKSVDTKHSEVTSQRPRKIEERSFPEEQSVGVRDRIKQIEKYDDKRPPVSKQMDDLRVKRQDSKEMTLNKKSEVSVTTKSATAPDRVKSPVKEQTVQTIQVPEVKIDRKPAGEFSVVGLFRIGGNNNITSA